NTSSTQAAWGACYLTDEGRERLQGADHPLPEDIESYLDRVRSNAPNTDELSLFYVEQALRAFRAGVYPSALVMLGCCGEHFVQRLARALVPKLPRTEGARIAAMLESGASVAKVWERFRRSFEKHRATVFGKSQLIATSETMLD